MRERLEEKREEETKRKQSSRDVIKKFLCPRHKWQMALYEGKSLTKPLLTSEPYDTWDSCFSKPV